MNREILFKAKRIDNGEWVEGDLLHTTHPEIVIISDFADKAYRCDGNTLCQYTGLTDKNDRKIFENDVIKNGDLFGKIKYVNCYFRINWFIKNIYGKLVRHSTQVLFDAKRYSIFDNPELLEVRYEDYFTGRNL